MADTRLSQFGRRFVAHPAGPTVLALLLAMVALPIVALTLNEVETTSASYSSVPHSPAQLPSTDLGRWTAAFGAVVVSALVAGTVGGRIARRRNSGEILTIVLAWVCAIVAAPLLPAILGQHVGFGVICIDSCSVPVSAANPTSGAFAALLFPVAALFETNALLTLVVGYGIWLGVIRHYRPTA